MIKDEIQGENNQISSIMTRKAEFLPLVLELLANLPERSQSILKKRYGISEANGKTLEEIGREYHITRERVRQIISDARKNLTRKLEEERFRQYEEKLILDIIKSNDIIKETEIVAKFNKDGFAEGNAIRFFAYCSSKIIVIEEKGVIEKCWSLKKKMKDEVLIISKEAENLLKKTKRTMSSQEIARELAKKLSHLSEEQIISQLGVLVNVEKNRFGKWGMANWSEINPKGTREKIYLVLKEENRPLHFTEIATLIDKYKLGSKKAHPQTVHNELIKDNRYVLIGRGIYALREWGYSSGTIKDVLTEIMTHSPKPLTKEEILVQVLKVRKVKKTTIMINLNNSNVFVRERGMYSLRK